LKTTSRSEKNIIAKNAIRRRQIEGEKEVEEIGI
jgi:hypothetical protein